MAVGRISGPLLKSNLIRNGINLAFETDLLYLDVNNQRIGVKTTEPQYELDINGTSQTVDLIVTNKADLADITVEGSTISTTQPFLNLATLDTVVSLNKLRIDSIDIEGNAITTNTSNADLELRPNGTGSVRVYSDLNVDGNIFASGNITAEGDIIVGNSIAEDTVVFNAEVASDIIPDQTNTRSLGSDPESGGKEWNDVWVNNLVASSINSEALDVDGIDLTFRPETVYYVAKTGNDDKSGNHILDPFLTIKKALSEASEGDVVYVYPGVYEEEFPLTVPQGVTLQGDSIRGVNIQPTLATNNNDAFLLNGETTVENLTVSNFYTGYAFKFAPGFTVTSRSPYLKNISVITQGSVTDSVTDPRGFDAGDAGKGALVDGSVATASSKEAAMLFHSVTFITPGVDGLVATNGARIEWLNSFTYFADRSIYASDGVTGLKGSGQTALRVDNVTGSFTDGETITYYDTDGVSVLATGVINGLDADGKFYIDGKQQGFETPQQRGGKLIVANGDAQLSTSLKKFGTASLALDGAGDYASISAQDDFGFGTGDFTVEAWVYKTADTGQEAILDFRAQASDNAVIIGVRNSNQPYVYVNGAYEIQSTTALTLSDWNHIAYTRNGTTGTLYLNGTSVGTWTDNTDYGTTKPLIIGAGYTGGFTYWTGNIDEVRIIKGSAEYTSNFTVPTLRLNVTDETVLMARFDGDNTSTVFEDDVIYAQDIRFSGGATATEITLTDFTDFGAEIRLIGSASVYGNYGLVGNGPGVIMYAIGHNLAYIGNGKEVTNDVESVIQDNEVIETNDAKIRYNSVDHKGDFRVGDLFYVNQEDGTVDFTVSNFTVNTEDGITFITGGNTTYIDGTKIETGNWRISGNTIETLSGDANFDSVSANINLNGDVNVSGSLDVTGNVTIGGNITIGDETTDTIQIVAGIDSDIIPKEASTYSLGTATKTWSNLFVNEIISDNIRIRDNFIETVDSNSDLELRANGTGEVLIPENDVQVDQELRVQGDTTLTNTNINGDITQVGNTVQTGNIDLTGNLNITGEVTISSSTQFEDILIENNVITTTQSNSDLELKATVFGEVIIPDNNVNISNNLIVEDTITVNDLVSSDTITSEEFSTGNISIKTNYITTTQSNSDLELSANGTGEVTVTSNDVVLDQDLTVLGTTDVQDLNINGTVTQVGNTTQTGDFTLTGNLAVTGKIDISASVMQFENIQISGNTIATTESNSDLELRANGTGEIFVPSNNVYINNNLTVIGTTDVGNIISTGQVTANRFSTGDVLIDDNFITTTNSNSDLELRANGTGSIIIDTFDINGSTISTSGNFTIEPGSEIVNIDATGALKLPVGTTLERPTATAGQIRYNTDLSRFEGFNGTNWINLKGVEDLDGDTKVTAELTEGANDNTIRFDVAGSTIVTVNSTALSAPRINVDDIRIDGNVISTTTNNTNLELTANGTGSVKFDNFAFKDNTITNISSDAVTVFESTNNGYVKFDGTYGIVLPVGSSGERPPIEYVEIGQVRFNTDDNRVELYDGSNWVSVAGAASGITRNEAEDIAFEIALSLG